jgi:hypothetical protein
LFRPGTTFLGRASVRAVPAIQSADEDKIAILTDSHFGDGSIEGYISGNLLPSAGSQARGFVGIAFRIDENVSSFEAIYLRPTNARADDQRRRNHSVQYISYPDFPWHRLRREAPAKYETYADMVPGEWIHFRLDVQGQSVRLYLNNSEQPVLIINDLKQGGGSGRVGLWVGPGTEAHFSDITVNSTLRSTALAD